MGQYQYETTGGFGLERETLRVDADGKLAQTPHPFGEDEHITRDFCENQIELITPVCHSVEEAVASLGELDEKARAVLAQQGEQIGCTAIRRILRRMRRFRLRNSAACIRINATTGKPLNAATESA